MTSPSSGEGKSTVTTNLAASIAATGVRVLVVEADLRRPQVHNYFGVEGGAGLTDILIGRAELADVVQPWRSPNLHILAAGRIPPNPSELLGSHQMRELMTQLQERYDVVLYDTPPVLPVPDAAILSRTVGGVLLVTSIDHTRRDEVRSAVIALEEGQRADLRGGGEPPPRPGHDVLPGRGLLTRAALLSGSPRRRARTACPTSNSSCAPRGAGRRWISTAGKARSREAADVRTGGTRRRRNTTAALTA